MTPAYSPGCIPATIATVGPDADPTTSTSGNSTRGPPGCSSRTHVLVTRGSLKLFLTDTSAVRSRAPLDRSELAAGAFNRGERPVELRRGVLGADDRADASPPGRHAWRGERRDEDPVFAKAGAEARRAFAVADIDRRDR